MSDDKKRDEKPLAGAPLASSAPELPQISLGGGVPPPSAAGMFAGTAGKIALVAMIGAVGVGAVGVFKVIAPSESSNQAPLSFFASHPPVAAKDAAPPAPPQDGVQVIPPPEAATTGAGGSAASGSDATAAASATGAAGTVTASGPDAAPGGKGSRDAVAGAAAGASAGTAAPRLAVPAADLKPGGPTGAGSGAFSSASMAASGSAAGRATGGSPKGIAANEPAARGGSAIASNHGRGALRQLQANAVSSRLGAISSGEASAAAAGRNFDNGSAITGRGAGALGGAGTGQTPPGNKKAYNGGSPIDTSGGGMPYVTEPPHKDVTPWAGLVKAATLLLLAGGLLLLAAELLAQKGFHTVAAWLATVATAAGATVLGIGTKILLDGGAMQGGMFMLGGGLLTFFAGRAAIGEFGAAAKEQAAQKAAAAQTQARTDALIKDGHYDPVKGSCNATPKQDPLTSMLDKASAPTQAPMSSQPPPATTASTQSQGLFNTQSAPINAPAGSEAAKMTTMKNAEAQMGDIGEAEAKNISSYSQHVTKVNGATTYNSENIKVDPPK